MMYCFCKYYYLIIVYNMGIERFFNSLKKLYGHKIISKVSSNTYLPQNCLYIDFNSIIHNVSQIISSSIIYLYHIHLINLIYPDILKLHHDNIKNHIIKISTNNSFILSANLQLPDRSDDELYNVSINFNALNIEQIDSSFFQIIMLDDNLDKLIINKVIEHVENLSKMFPQLKELYAAIDGVPLYAKMVEQKNRRMIGHLIELSREKLLEFYKDELNINPTIYENGPKDDIYYNHYQFEIQSKKLRFNKNKISPGTKFMSNLQNELNGYFGNNKFKFKFILDPYENPGEGEKKIVFKIIKTQSENIVTYSPDADVILLMLIESNKANINIMRYDQQSRDTELIDINELKTIIIKYMKYDRYSDDIKYRALIDIVMLFAILGNDFIPKIVNTNKDIQHIIDAYSKLNDNAQNFIFIKDDNQKYKIRWLLLKQFFMILDRKLERIENKNYRRNKEWKLEPNQIVNSNAIPYYIHLFNIENLTNIYDPNSISNLKYNTITEKINIKKIYRRYLDGWAWLAEYYLNHNLEYKLFSYNYESKDVLNIKDLIYHISKYEKKDRSEQFKKMKITDEQYFTPVYQLAYISPINILDIVDSKYLDKNRVIRKKLLLYDQTYNSEIDLKVVNSQINLFDYLNCVDVPYLSKCAIKKNKIRVTSILKFFYDI